MKSLFFISIILLNLYVGNVDAQTLEPYTVDQNKDSLFHKTIGYLHKNQYFIDCVDTTSGFIKAKKYVKNENLLSVILGRRTELSVSGDYSWHTGHGIKIICYFCICV